MDHRIERFSSTLKNTLADIFRSELNNPHLQSLSIIDVTVTPDLKKARVYVAPLAGDWETFEKEELSRRLDRAKGFIKKALSRNMYLKYTPELDFVMGTMPQWNEDNSPASSSSSACENENSETNGHLDEKEDSQGY